MGLALGLALYLLVLARSQDSCLALRRSRIVAALWQLHTVLAPNSRRPLCGGEVLVHKHARLEAQSLSLLHPPPCTGLRRGGGR